METNPLEEEKKTYVGLAPLIVNREVSMTTVKQILDSKGYQVYTISSKATVFEALKLMGEKEVGALAVVDKDRLVGIISERDYARKVILRGRTSRDTLVGEIMTSNVFTAHLYQTVEECMSLMTERRIRHLPVMSGGRLTGMISIGDLVKSIIAKQQFVIEQLETYITQ
jgi:CBS domain-containing protein